MNDLATDSTKSTSPPLYRQAQEWLVPALRGGNAYAIDATCGNGHDTLFLCRSLENDKMVFGFDLQQQALEMSRQKLAAHQFAPHLHQVDHANFEEFFTQHAIHSIQAAIFNLGYLPGGDHSLVTQPDSTLLAIESILNRATDDFRLSVVAYRGHPGGQEEASRVQSFLQQVDDDRFWFSQSEGMNRDTGPIFLGLRSLSLTQHPKS